MYAEALLLEMLTDRDIEFALVATGSVPGPRLEGVVRSLREDPDLLAALLEDHRLGPATALDPQILLKVSPYFFFSVLLRRAHRELRARTFTAEWLGPRRRVPVFDAARVAATLDDPARVHYLAELLASFTASRHDGEPGRAPSARPQRRAVRVPDVNLEHLRRARQRAAAADHFALDRRLGDLALFLAGVFPDCARGALELDEWEAESENRYRRAAADPRARQCGLEEILAGLAGELHPARKALNFVADRFLQPLRCGWFSVGA
ncbi:MAG TPA: hypothetical protein VNM16_08845 [Bacillota bacterium]|nr:hypothetical protein [Bacillota bacterium]